MPSGEAASAPKLVVLCGLPGVGKTTVGKHIVEQTDGRLVRTDTVRKELFDQPDYTDAETETVYETVIQRGVDTVSDGDYAVLDGTFRERSLRDQVEAAANRAGVSTLFVRVTCEESQAIERIRNRTDDESDAEVEDYAHFREIFDPLEREHVSIDNSETLEHVREQVNDHF
jgi:predicted kinase